MTEGDTKTHVCSSGDALLCSIADQINLASFEECNVKVPLQHASQLDVDIFPRAQTNVDHEFPHIDDGLQVVNRVIRRLSLSNGVSVELGEKEYDSGSCSSLDSSREHRSNLDFGEHVDPDKWAARYNELLEYREKYGHCNVPYHYKEKPFLNSWVKRQRYQYKCLLQGKPTHLNSERIRLLDSINFAWDTHALAWEANFEAFRQHVKTHNHCHIPAKETRLFAWAKRQRRQHKLWLANKDTTMTEDRYRRLTTLGFRWGVRPLCMTSVRPSVETPDLSL